MIREHMESTHTRCVAPNLQVLVQCRRVARPGYGHSSGAIVRVVRRRKVSPVARHCVRDGPVARAEDAPRRPLVSEDKRDLCGVEVAEETVSLQREG